MTQDEVIQAVAKALGDRLMYTDELGEDFEDDEELTNDQEEILKDKSVTEVAKMPSFSYEFDGRGWSEQEVFYKAHLNEQLYLFHACARTGDSGNDAAVHYCPIFNDLQVQNIVDHRKAMIDQFNILNGLVQSPPSGLVQIV